MRLFHLSMLAVFCLLYGGLCAEKKIALLFLIRDDLNHSNVLKSLLVESAHKSEFTIYIPDFPNRKTQNSGY